MQSSVNTICVQFFPFPSSPLPLTQQVQHPPSPQSPPPPPQSSCAIKLFHTRSDTHKSDDWRTLYCSTSHSRRYNSQQTRHIAQQQVFLYTTSAYHRVCTALVTSTVYMYIRTHIHWVLHRLARRLTVVFLYRPCFHDWVELCKPC